MYNSVWCNYELCFAVGWRVRWSMLKQLAELYMKDAIADNDEELRFLLYESGDWKHYFSLDTDLQFGRIGSEDVKFEDDQLFIYAKGPFDIRMTKGQGPDIKAKLLDEDSIMAQLPNDTVRTILGRPTVVLVGSHCGLY